MATAITWVACEIAYFWWIFLNRLSDTGNTDAEHLIQTVAYSPVFGLVRILLDVAFVALLILYIKKFSGKMTKILALSIVTIGVTGLFFFAAEVRAWTTFKPSAEYDIGTSLGQTIGYGLFSIPAYPFGSTFSFPTRSPIESTFARMFAYTLLRVIVPCFAFGLIYIFKKPCRLQQRNQPPSSPSAHQSTE